MKTLNLVNQEQGDIKFTLFSFPDGQQQIRIDKESLSPKRICAPRVIIQSRLNNFKDLEVIICAVASLRELKVDKISLYVPYFLGSRSDRKFQEGENNYLKDVICPIINSLKFESVITLDPHSDVLEACLNNFVKRDNKELVNWAIRNIHETLGIPFSLEFPTGKIDYPFVLVSPDAGANKKIYKLAEQIDYIGSIITCSKLRDNEGKLSKTFVPLTSENLDKNFIIIDDLIDGGATFLNIAKEIKKWDTTNSCKIYLIVTHGIFSKGLKELNEYFDGIYCTNSYSDNFKYKGLEQYPGEFDKIKQYNVF